MSITCEQGGRKGGEEGGLPVETRLFAISGRHQLRRLFSDFLHPLLRGQLL